MYIAGVEQDFENRMHQLPEVSGDLSSFVTEGQSYLGGSPQAVEKFNREYRLKKFSLSGDATAFNETPFTYGGNPLSGLIVGDDNGVAPYLFSVADQATVDISNGGYTFISTLDCVLLTNFSCNENNITSLDLSTNTSLVSVSCNNCSITSLTLPSTSTLVTVSANDNQISSININGCPNLKFLHLGNSQLGQAEND